MSPRLVPRRDVGAMQICSRCLLCLAANANRTNEARRRCPRVCVLARDRSACIMWRHAFIQLATSLKRCCQTVGVRTNHQGLITTDHVFTAHQLNWTELDFVNCGSCAVNRNDNSDILDPESRDWKNKSGIAIPSCKSSQWKAHVHNSSSVSSDSQTVHRPDYLTTAVYG